ncbi:MAG: hypothetical protein A4E55_01039 [Pelotomaculum sp. PtaU1.Bin035]|nr:MAG: hypothetical protein A4E55_01039 [Pelotomaculum sp. PtaU1.Bin035]
MLKVHNLSKRVICMMMIALMLLVTNSGIVFASNSDNIYKYNTKTKTFSFNNGSEVQVLSDSLNDLLLVYGSPEGTLKSDKDAIEKVRVVKDKLAPTQNLNETSNGEVSARTTSVRYLGDYEETDYGDGQVYSRQEGTATMTGGTYVQDVVTDGHTRTAWSGTSPQWYSSKIKLSESWKFNGISVTVSYPPSFSGSGDTVTWEGEDTSGTHYTMDHYYNGVSGRSYVSLWSLTKRSTGSHYFSSTGAWVSAFCNETI